MTLSIKAMVDSRWWSLFTMLDSFWENKETLRFQRDSLKNLLVAPDVHNLTEVDWRDIQVICKMVSGFKDVQMHLEGEKYITVSLVIPAVELVRQRLQRRGRNVRLQRRWGECAQRSDCCF